MTQIFSSDDTEFIRIFPAVAITHGFSQRRPVRSLQIPPEVVKSPTDFTDIHRFFLGLFFCHADFADDADFFSSSDDTEFRIGDLFDRCRYPLGLDKAIHQRFHKKSVYICEICGTKIIPRRKICVICEICVTKNNMSMYRARAIGQRPNICANP